MWWWLFFFAAVANCACDFESGKFPCYEERLAQTQCINGSVRTNYLDFAQLEELSVPLTAFVVNEYVDEDDIIEAVAFLNGELEPARMQFELRVIHVSLKQGLEEFADPDELWAAVWHSGTIASFVGSYGFKVLVSESPMKARTDYGVGYAAGRGIASYNLPVGEIDTRWQAQVMSRKNTHFINKILSHEVLHALGLPHVFADEPCRAGCREDDSNLAVFPSCEFLGDFLPDTGAAPPVVGIDSLRGCERSNYVFKEKRDLCSDGKKNREYPHYEPWNLMSYHLCESHPGPRLTAHQLAMARCVFDQHYASLQWHTKWIRAKEKLAALASTNDVQFFYPKEETLWAIGSKGAFILIDDKGKEIDRKQVRNLFLIPFADYQASLISEAASFDYSQFEVIVDSNLMQFDTVLYANGELVWNGKHVLLAEMTAGAPEKVVSRPFHLTFDICIVKSPRQFGICRTKAHCERRNQQLLGGDLIFQAGGCAELADDRVGCCGSAMTDVSSAMMLGAQSQHQFDGQTVIDNAEPEAVPGAGADQALFAASKIAIQGHLFIGGRIQVEIELPEAGELAVQRAAIDESDGLVHYLDLLATGFSLWLGGIDQPLDDYVLLWNKFGDPMQRSAAQLTSEVEALSGEYAAMMSGQIRLDPRFITDAGMYSLRLVAAAASSELLQASGSGTTPIYFRQLAGGGDILLSLSRPLSLNYAPCFSMKAFDFGEFGTCFPHRPDDPAFVPRPCAHGWTDWCNHLGRDMKCCRGEPTSALGSYRLGGLDDAQDAQSSGDLLTMGLAIGGGAAFLLLLMCAMMMLLLLKRRRTVKRRANPGRPPLHYLSSPGKSSRSRSNTARGSTRRNTSQRTSRTSREKVDFFHQY